MKENILPGLIIFFIILMSCSDNSTGYKKDDAIYIRIENLSDTPFTDVLAVFPQDSIQYGIIAATSKSSYAKVSKAYSYSYVKVVTANQTYILQPIDYIGAELLENGYYTYQLNLTGVMLYDITFTFEANNYGS